MYRLALCDVSIVFMTDGRNSHLCSFGIQSDPSPEQLRQIRNHEARAAATILGIQNDYLIFLDFEDTALEASSRQARGKVDEVLAWLNPCEVFFPSAEDNHPDHRVTNAIVGASVRAVCPSASTRQYTIWSDRRQPALTNDGVIVDISRVLAVKRRALRVYRSQTTRLFRNQPRPVLSTAFVRGFMRPVEAFADTESFVTPSDSSE